MRLLSIDLNETKWQQWQESSSHFSFFVLPSKKSNKQHMNIRLVSIFLFTFTFERFCLFFSSYSYSSSLTCSYFKGLPEKYSKRIFFFVDIVSFFYSVLLLVVFPSTFANLCSNFIFAYVYRETDIRAYNICTQIY